MIINNEQIFLRLAVAVILGGVVGWDRERLDWAAGLRTHMLVCLGSCLFMIVSSYGFMDMMNYPQIKLDPSRVASQVVSGVGFLGAGTIMFRRNVIRGLTTAASLWAVAAVGLAAGGGMYMAALVTTFFIVTILVWLKPLEKRIFQNRRPRSLQLIIAPEASLFAVEAALEAAGIRFTQIVVRQGDTPHEHHVEVVLSQATPKHLLPLLDKLRAITGVQEVSYAAL